MYLIIKTDSETSDLGRISTPFTTLPTLQDIIDWNGKPLENDGNCVTCTWTVVNCNTGQEEGSISITMEGDMWETGNLVGLRTRGGNGEGREPRHFM